MKTAPVAFAQGGCGGTAAPASGRLRRALERMGHAMARHRGAIVGIQAAVVVGYAVLLIAPAFMPLPAQDAHLWNNLRLFAQFVFWGLWWPFVMVTTMLLGRVWCGVFCPEGAITELASRHGLRRRIPRWLRWGGWPFIAFAGTTVFGQLVSVYEYPQAALLVLGGSTVAAVTIGFLYGRGVRVWCRYLCPANGVFALLARLAPVHFAVSDAAWRAAPRSTPAVDCPPILDVRHLAGTGACHACGRCSGHRGAVALRARSPNAEILGRTPDSRWEAVLIAYGLLGLAVGAFQWSSSPWFVRLKQTLAEWAVMHDWAWLLSDQVPWWLLTPYPEANDVFTRLDGLCILLYIGATALAVGGWITGWLAVAGRLLRNPALSARLTFALTPLAGISVFLGLTMLTFGQLAAERIRVPGVPALRIALLALAVGWSLHLAWRMLAPQPIAAARKAGALTAVAVGLAVVPAAWGLMFHVW
ncbi:MAG: 4Fe-4S binding protein [Gammaproteobacteria bacterium]|nr:4Fe-4S binding protein [Gammaproteobacteria bacterium]